MFSRRPKTLFAAVVFSLLFFASVNTSKGQNLPAKSADNSLPEKIGEYRAVGPIESQNPSSGARIESSGVISTMDRRYVSRAGQRFLVSLTTTNSDSAAFAELTRIRSEAESSANALKVENVDVGTSAVFFSGQSSSGRLAFFKGRTFVMVRNDKASEELPLMSFGKTLADTLDKGAGEIPVLVKHLPDWQNPQSRILYAVSQETLKNAFSNQSVLDTVNFAGGAEAVVANYGERRLVVVEFSTASLASDNDQRIKAKLQELRGQGQSVPSAYRRVGNYGVFVFDAPNEQAANQLIDQVKYEQVVQWLGENPYAYEAATREFTETTLGVLVAVVKTSGLALFACLAAGGLFGALLFRFRRAQQRSMEAYTDAGAMLRLNLDEMTPESDPSRLLSPGK